jgi:hypothetical protein
MPIQVVAELGETAQVVAYNKGSQHVNLQVGL